MTPIQIYLEANATTVSIITVVLALALVGLITVVRMIAKALGQLRR